MKTKFIYVVLMALFLGSQITASYTGADDADADQSDGESVDAG